MTDRNIITSLSLSLLIVLSTAGVAFAKDSRGTVSSIMVDESNTQGLRVKLTGITNFCDTTSGVTPPQNPHVAYLAADHPLYDTIIRLVTAAFMAGKPITIRANQGSSAFCRITGAILD